MNLSTLSPLAMEAIAIAARYNVVVNDMLLFLKEHAPEPRKPRGLFDILMAEPPIVEISRFITREILSGVDPRAIPINLDGEDKSE